MFPKLSFLFFICFCSAKTKNEKHFDAIQNVHLSHKKFLENQIASKYAANEILCTQYCAAEPTCVSFNYNTGSGTCVLFDQDFTDVAATAYKPEDKWFYYYLIRDICSLFCFYYFEDNEAVYTHHASKCSVLDGGEVVRIHRGLKHHCVKNLLGSPLVSPLVPYVYIQGTKNFDSDNWEFDDGTNIMSIRWGNNQPNDDGAAHLVLSTTNFLWYDVSTTWSKSEGHAVVCQQK